MAPARDPGRITERPLAGLLLAAGGSRRLGQPKQLVRVDGQPLVRRQARLLAELIDPLIVVTGAFATEVRTALTGVDWREAHHPDWQRGLGSSLAAGASRVEADAAGVLVMLCDQYRVQRATLQQLVEAWREVPATACACRWAGADGPPVIFPPSMLPALRALDGDRGARVLLAEQPQTRWIEAPEAAADLDTPDDLDSLGQSPSR